MAAYTAVPPSSVVMPCPGPAASAMMTSLVMTSSRGGQPQTAALKKHRHDDEEQGKLFVGGLSWDTTQETLLQYFSRFGDVIDCVVMKNVETGRSRGFGFVTYSDPSNIDRVLASCPHSLDGRTIDPKACNPRSLQKPKRNTYLPKVFLGGLPSSITETDLRNFFSRYGEVCEVVIMYDQEKKKSRGFGFLSFGDETACSRAVAEHFVNIQNKQVEIKRAEPRTNQIAGSTPMGMEGAEVKVESIDGQEWAIYSAVPITNGHGPPPPPQAPPPAQLPAVTAYSSWGTPTQSAMQPQAMPHQPPSAYPAQYGQIPVSVAAPPNVPWGQPPPSLPPPVPAGHPGHWASPSPGPHMGVTAAMAAYASPPPPVVTSQVQQFQPTAVYALPSTPQPQMWVGPPPGPTPPPQAVSAPPPMGHPDLYGGHPMPAASPHQVNKLPPSAGYAYGPPPVMQAPVAYAFQSPPPSAAGSQSGPLGSKQMPIQGTVFYSSGEFFQPQSQSEVSSVAAYPQVLDLRGGPQRGMYTQPTQLAAGYHPYRRS